MKSILAVLPHILSLTATLRNCVQLVSNDYYRATMKIFLPLAISLALMMPDAVSAADVHLKGGKNAEPIFIDHGLKLEAQGELSGLGGGDVLVNMTATADVIATCTNQGGTQAPGQNPAPLTVTGAVVIPEKEAKNGNTPFMVETIPPNETIPGAPDCPNPNWTEEIEDLKFTSATITVQQPEGNVVLIVVCAISPESENGVIPGRHVTCTQTQY
jgi:hypothetical protein